MINTIDGEGGVCICKRVRVVRRVLSCVENIIMLHP